MATCNFIRMEEVKEVGKKTKSKIRNDKCVLYLKESATIPAFWLGRVRLWRDFWAKGGKKTGARQCPIRCGWDQLQRTLFETTQ
jgi:hypothetical protein